MMTGASALAMGLVLAFAGPASAHTADASVTQTCVNGTSQSTVLFRNNFDIPATLTFTGPKASSLALPAMEGSTPGTNSVTVTVTAPSTLTYTVRWEDGVTQGSRSVPLQPINDCLPATTTTVPEVQGVTLVPTTTTPPTTAPPVTPTVAATPETTVAAQSPNAIVAPPQQPAAVRPASLPTTGTGPVVLVSIAVALMVVGGVLAATRRRAL
jgi:LPXTG-motif cell wall-anchored protein